MKPERWRKIEQIYKAAPQINIITNWLEEPKRIVPPK